MKPTPNFVGMSVGALIQLKAQAYAPDGTPITDDLPFRWASTDSTVLAVDQAGNVRAKASGRATISAALSDNGRVVQGLLNLDVIVIVLGPSAATGVGGGLAHLSGV